MIPKGRSLTAGKTALFALLLMLTPAGGLLAQSSRIDQAILDEPNQKTREVSTDELKRILASKSAVVLDTRPHREFAMSHIPGAQNVAPKPGIPVSMYVSDVREVERLVNGDKGKPLVLYCNGPFCGKSKRLSEELLAAGFTNVRRYQLGIPVWRLSSGSPRSSSMASGMCSSTTGPQCSAMPGTQRSSTRAASPVLETFPRAWWSRGKTSVR